MQRKGRQPAKVSQKSSPRIEARHRIVGLLPTPPGAVLRLEASGGWRDPGSFGFLHGRKLAGPDPGSCCVRVCCLTSCPRQPAHGCVFLASGGGG